MQKNLSELDNSSPKEIADKLRKNFQVYQTSNLEGIDPEEFARSIQSKLGVIDAETEGYSEDDSSKPKQKKCTQLWYAKINLNYLIINQSLFLLNPHGLSI